MKLVPIDINPQQNRAFTNPACRDVITATLDFYKSVGFHKPWIGYFASDQDFLVGMGGFKGQPKAGSVEIAYGTFVEFEGKGMGTRICRELVLLARRTDAALRITARTLPEQNASTTILQRNNFICLGGVWDEEDGNVWEWEYQG